MSDEPPTLPTDARRLVFVYDVHQGYNRWVYAKYTDAYPQLYVPVSYNGVLISTHYVQ
jgi:hypothetical protein